MASPIVRIARLMAYGSGTFIGENLVLTAAHVVQPRHHGLLPPQRYRVLLDDGRVLRVRAVLSHRRWAAGFDVTADLALLRVAAPDQRTMDVVLDAGANGLDVEVSGYLPDATPVHAPGTVTRCSHPGEFDTFHSSDLSFPPGISGAPMLSDGRVVGLATRSPPAPAPDSFVGLPLLDATLGWLRSNLP